MNLTNKGSGKYTFTMPASKVEIKATFVKKVETSPFSDVSTNAYYYEAVKWAQEKGITGGIGNGLFGPNQPCTRAQIVTFLWRAAGSPVVNYAMNMSDVPEGSYYAAVEGSRGEFGVFIESRGEKSPYRMKFRSTGLPLVSCMETIARGAKIADLIAIGGTLDYVVPDIDR